MSYVGFGSRLLQFIEAKRKLKKRCWQQRVTL